MSARALAFTQKTAHIKIKSDYSSATEATNCFAPPTDASSVWQGE